MQLIGNFCERSERVTENTKAWFGGKKFVQCREEKYFWKVRSLAQFLALLVEKASMNWWEEEMLDYVEEEQ